MMINSLSQMMGSGSVGGQGSHTDPTPPKPVTVQESVAQPLTNAQLAVTQLPATGQSDWKQSVDPDSQQKAAQVGAGVDRQTLNDAVGRINQYLHSYNTNLHFEVDEDYGKSVIRVVDQGNHKVVRQIPSETALALGQFFDEMAIIKSRQAASTLGDSGQSSTKGFLLQKTT